MSIKYWQFKDLAKAHNREIRLLGEKISFMNYLRELGYVVKRQDIKSWHTLEFSGRAECSIANHNR